MANNQASMDGLAAKARREGVRILTGSESPGSATRETPSLRW